MQPHILLMFGFELFQTYWSIMLDKLSLFYIMPLTQKELISIYFNTLFIIGIIEAHKIIKKKLIISDKNLLFDSYWIISAIFQMIEKYAIDKSETYIYYYSNIAIYKMICMLRLKNIVKYRFSVNWLASPHHILSAVKQQTKKNNNFVKDNGIYIINHLLDMLERRLYDPIDKFTNEVNLKAIQKWSIWLELSKNIQKQLEQIEGIQVEELVKLLQILFNLRYEINQSQNPIFLNLIKDIIKRSELHQSIKISAFLLSSNYRLFLHLRNQFQKLMLIQSAEYGMVKNRFYFFTIIQGIISDFWTQKFINQFSSIIKPQQKSEHQGKYEKVSKLLAFSNLSLPNDLQEQQNFVKKSGTEYRIGLMLNDLGYNCRQNINVNEMEVDFLFQGMKTILQYNGMTHYKINSPTRIQNAQDLEHTQYQKWKNIVLEKRGFNIIQIPFIEWEKYQGEKEQKMFLIQKIEKHLLKQFQKSQNKLIKP